LLIENYGTGAKVMTTTYWMNIDRPSKRCQLHRSDCNHVQSKFATPLKGVGELRSEGGWLEFGSIPDAIAYFDRNYRKLEFDRLEKCQDCWRPIDWLTIAAASLNEFLQPEDDVSTEEANIGACLAY
jgi:hypothetical protein